MLAVALLASGVLLLCQVLISALKLSGQSRDSAIAAQGAQQILEQIRAGVQPPSTAASFDGANNDPQTADGFPPKPYPGQQFDGRSYTYLVRSQPIAAKPGLYDVSVTVTWTGGHRAQLETHVFLP